eukprot:5856110-Amphidinium_carterae.1
MDLLEPGVFWAQDEGSLRKALPRSQKHLWSGVDHSIIIKVIIMKAVIIVIIVIMSSCHPCVKK